MGEINKIDSDLELKQRAITLGLKFEKKRKIYKAIYLSVGFLVLIGLAVTIADFFRYKNINVNILTNSTIVSVVIISLVCFYTSDWILINFSKSLKMMQKELEELNRQVYPEIFEKQEKNKPVKEKNIFDKIKLIIAFIFFVIGTITLISTLILTDTVSTKIFLTFLILGIWIVIYSFFVMYSKRIIRSLYYPTAFLLILAAPPLLTAWLTQSTQTWIMVLSIIIAVLFGLFLLFVFLYYSVYRPSKLDREFLKENWDLFEERESEQDGYMTEIINKKKDRALISVWRNTKHSLIVEKWISEEPPYFKKIKELEFVEYLNAYFAAIKEVVDLYKADDGREEVELEQKLRKFTEFDIKEIYENLSQQECLKDKISIHDETIFIEFHKYLKVRLCDDYCEYFNTHWHPDCNEDSLEFIEDLLNERFVFYQNKSTGQRKQYDGCYLEKLIKTKNKKFCKVFSAMKIYVDK